MTQEDQRAQDGPLLRELRIALPVDVGMLEGDVGERLDVEAGRDLDDLRRDVGPRQ